MFFETPIEGASVNIRNGYNQVDEFNFYGHDCLWGILLLTNLAKFGEYEAINDKNMIEEFAQLIPAGLNNLSGSVFYSGRNAFQGKKSLYVLGLNPGGDVVAQQNQTVAWHTLEVLKREKKCWSEYKDESWKGSPAGTYGLQPRVLHLFNLLNEEACNIPSSNVCFVRSNREKAISSEFKNYAELCWPFHKSVIDELGIKVILCFGKKSGNFVRNKLNANILIDQFVEVNKRRWKSLVFKNTDGQKVIVATHPSIADWTKPETDPSPLIIRNLPK